MCVEDRDSSKLISGVPTISFGRINEVVEMHC